MPRAGIDDINQEVDVLKREHPQLNRGAAFCLWFVLAQIVNDEREGLDAIVDGPNDKNLDAIVIDSEARTVYFVQSKLRDSLGGRAEPRNNLIAFASLAALPTQNRARRRAFLNRMAPRAQMLLESALRKITREHYLLHLYYVTTATCSQTVRDDAVSAARGVNDAATYEVFDASSVGPLLQDYLSGMAPPPGRIKLTLTGQVAAEGILTRREVERGLITWIVTAASREVAELYRRHGDRLFARNVRGFLGEKSKINSELAATLSGEPANFWYFNNGVTIICDRAEMRDALVGRVLEIHRPQIINGQQTTRVIATSKSSAAEVLVRVIAVSRGDSSGVDYESLLSKIVRATNWQNQIKQSDLVVNDVTQIRLERELRKRGYQYIRKRQTKQEARRERGGSLRFQLTKFDLAMAVAACNFDPAVPLLGKEALFGEQYCKEIFPVLSAANVSINYADPSVLDTFLTKYWAMTLVKSAARGQRELAYAKWLVLHDIWLTALRRLDDARRKAFVAACERGATTMIEPLIKQSFQASMAFYAAKNKEAGDILDRQSFFKQRGLYRQFISFILSRSAIADRREDYLGTLVELLAGHA